jgi:hypothetical protein
MSTYTTEVWYGRRPQEVLAVLTEPEAIARWTPVDFDVLELDGNRLVTGSRARVSGGVAGCRVGFDVDIREAHERCLSLVATGPVLIDAEYRLRPVRGGSEVRASVSVSGGGLFGRTLARAIESLLGAGFLRSSMARIGRELDAPARRRTGAYPQPVLNPQLEHV